MPSPQTAIDQPAPRRTLFLALASIVALASFLTLYRLGAADVCGFNEAVEGVFVQQMVEHGQLLFPLDNGRAPMYKPPLFHWTATALDHLAGARRVTPFNLRLPAALYAIAGVALTIVFAYDFLGLGGALLAGLILCASYQYIENARIGRVDMTLCFFETLALFSFAWLLFPRARSQRRHPPAENFGSSPICHPQPASNASHVEGPTRSDSRESNLSRNPLMHYLFALALGLAVLAKGPIGALIPTAACSLFLLCERRFADLRRLATTPGPILLTIVVGSSWYVACYFSGRYGFLDRQLGSENFGRFFGALGAMAPWYYLKPILLNSTPLSLLIPFAVYAALRTLTSPLGPAPASLPSSHSERNLRSEESRPHPASLEPFSVSDKARFRAAAIASLLAIFWLVTVVFFTLAAYKRRAYLLPLWPASAFLLAWIILRSAPAPRPDHVEVSGATVPMGEGCRRFLYPALLAVCALSILFNLFYLPRKEVRDCAADSLRTTAAQINRIVGPDEPLYSWRLGDEPAALIFYLGRNVPPLDGKLGDAPPGYVLIPADVWPRAQSAALDLTPVFAAASGRPRLLLLRHGPALADR